MKRLVLAAVGTTLLLAGLPAAAAPTRVPGSPSVAEEREALELLFRAARAGRSLSYRGTQYVAAWHDDATGTGLLEVSHDPGRAAVVTAPPTAGADSVPRTATAALDPRMVDLVAASYALRVAGTGRCTGRTTFVVEAAREDGQVAGRFWLDRDSGLLLRREAYDEGGRRISSSAFVDLELRSGSAPATAPAPLTAPEPVDTAVLRDRGWPVPDALPGGLRLFETRLTEPADGEQLLHLAYSDGLSTVSLFAQPGRLGTDPVDGFTEEQVGGRPVWVRHQSPERVVWSGGDRVWTLVSDAPGDLVRAAVEALPRDAAEDDGFLARLGRGLGRLASMLNPFD